MKYPDFNPKLLYYNVECKKNNAISDLFSSIVHATPLVKKSIGPATPSLGIFSKPSFYAVFPTSLIYTDHSKIFSLRSL